MSQDRNVTRPLPDDGTRGYRLEIDEFLTDNEMTNLFLIALYNLQQKSLDLINDNGKKTPDWMKFYAIGTIHGEPREAWNGYTNPEIGGDGYCHHGMDTFPTWHRPYMYMYEWSIYQEMINIAKQYGTEAERQTYLAAAARYRLPYWDIVMPRNKQSGDLDTIWGTPAVFAKHEVYVKLPVPTKDAKDGFDLLPNPLYSFKFPTEEEWQSPGGKVRDRLKWSKSNDGNWNTVRTARVPSNRSKGETDDEYFNLTIQRQASSFATSLWHLLNPDHMVAPIDPRQGTEKIDINEKRTWHAFSNHRVKSQDVGGIVYPTTSLESFHDAVHVLCGTGWMKDKTGNYVPLPGIPKSSWQGQMGDPAYAGFDPIFYMHHNNIDRLLAIYQAMWPEKYVDPTQADQELTPFMNGDGRKCYKSSDSFVKDFWNCGFAVPGNTKPTGEIKNVKKQLQKYLSDTYYWATEKRPHNLKDWPQNLTGSWALHGANATVGPSPTLHMSALSTQAGQVKLVHRAVGLASSEVNQPQSTPDDAPVGTTDIVKLTAGIIEGLPNGAYENVTDDSKPTVQLTWNAHVKVRKYAFNGSFSVHLFAGSVKDDQPQRFMTKKNEAGFTGVFATGGENVGGCANCVRQKDDDVLVEDVIPLTSFLYDYLRDPSQPSAQSFITTAGVEKDYIANLSVEEVVPFLKENLQWRVIDLGANLLEGREEEAKLEILITSRQFVAPSGDHLMGVYGPFVPHYEITQGKPGGANEPPVQTNGSS